MSAYLQGSMNKYFIVFATLFVSVGKGIIGHVNRRDLIQPAREENFMGIRILEYHHSVARREDDEGLFESESSSGTGNDFTTELHVSTTSIADKGMTKTATEESYPEKTSKGARMDLTTELSAPPIEDENTTKTATEEKCPEKILKGAAKSFAAISACLLVINIILLVMLYRLYHIKMSPPSDGNGNKKSTNRGKSVDKGMEMDDMTQNAYDVANDNTGKDGDSFTYEELESPNAADERSDERQEDHANTDIYEDVEDDTDDKVVYQNV